LKIILIVSVISIALMVLEKYKVPADTFFWRSIFDAGHIPLFGIISIAILRLLQTIWEQRFANPLIHYVIAFCLTGLLGLTTEIIQYFTPRDADIGDIVTDGVGAVCFLGLYLTFDRRLPGSGISLSRGQKYFIRFAVVILGLVAMIPTLNWIGAYIQRNNSFPEICTFESTWEQKFIFADNASLSIVPAPEIFGGINSNHVGRIDFKKSGNPAFIIAEPYPDWSGYDHLSFSVLSESPENLTLDFRINDRRHNNDYYDRFNRLLSIHPGLNRIRIPLKDVRMAPKTRQMNMQKIDLIILFAVKPENDITIYLDNFRLE